MRKFHLLNIMFSVNNYIHIWERNVEYYWHGQKLFSQSYKWSYSCPSEHLQFCSAHPFPFCVVVALYLCPPTFTLSAAAPLNYSTWNKQMVKQRRNGNAEQGASHMLMFLCLDNYFWIVKKWCNKKKKFGPGEQIIHQ